MIRFILTGSKQYTEDSFHPISKTIDIECPELQSILAHQKGGIQFVAGAEIIEWCPTCDKDVPVSIISGPLHKSYECVTCQSRWSLKK